MTPEPRPLAHLREYAILFPNAWRDIEAMRAARGKDLPPWPAWCYAPIAASIAVVTRGMLVPEMHRVSREAMRAAAGGDWAPLDAWAARMQAAAVVAALAAWRMGKGVYRLDPDLGVALARTPVEGDLPADVLLRLPEWGLYVELPPPVAAAVPTPSPLHGFYAHGEYDGHAGSPVRELRLVLDTEAGLVPVAVILGGTLAAGLDAVLTSGRRELADLGLGDTLAAKIPVAPMRPITEPLVSILLYLVSEAADVVGPPAGNPEPVRTRHGMRVFARDVVRVWDVGWRVGAALRAAVARHAAADADGHHARPRPHVRRAHWHHYWVGPRGDQRLALRWLHPVLVAGADPDSLPAVVRPVRP
jgi:hypothetical protein